MIEKIQDLKRLYYETKEKRKLDSMDYELLRKQFEMLSIEIPDINKIPGLDSSNSFCYICPDPENEFEYVIIIKSEGYEKNKEYMNLIFDAINEYYSYHYFYDEITNLSVSELIKIFINKYNIPVSDIYESSKTEKLNIRMFNYEH